MKLPSLHIDDDLAEVYMAEALERKMPVEQLLADRLVRAVPLDPRQRYVIVTDQPRVQLEALLGGGDVKNGDDLVQKVRRLARIRFGDHELKLSAGQLEEIAWRANKQGRTIEQMLDIAFKRFSDQFFTLVP